MKFLLGKKIEMTQVFDDNGTVIPVTVIQAGPCVVTQVKTQAIDGYNAIQIGFGKKKHVNKPQTGHNKKAGDEHASLGLLRELRIDGDAEKAVGDIIDVSVFEKGDKLAAVGQTKGKGFQGVVRRHGFSGSPASHGHKDQLRMPGSIGATDAARVFKGKKMAGRMGNDRKTIKNLEVVTVDAENNLIYLKGAVPGSRGSVVMLKA